MSEDKKTAQGLKEADPKEPVKAVKQEKAQSPKEPVYTVGELLSVCDKVFQVPKECLKAALKMEGKEAMTVSEAKAVLRRFMGRKVQ